MGFALRTIIEIVLVVALVWGIFNEQKLIAFEKNILAIVRRNKFKVIKNTPSYRIVRNR